MVASLLVLALASMSAATFINVLNDTFQDLSNWKMMVRYSVNSGNKEWQYYTNRSNNVYITQVNGQNALILKAIQENYLGANFTSGRVYSASSWGPYGFFNVKAIVPKGNGIWPAIWLLPPNSRSIYGNWAACGEIDIMETICTNTAGYATLHFGGESPNTASAPSNNTYPFIADWSNAHWYGVDWQPTYMSFWYDAQIVNGVITGGNLISSISSSSWYSVNTTTGQRYPGNAPFDTPFNIVLNVAVGGTWPCSRPGCCSNIAAPAQMTVFNVQVWQNAQSEDQL